MLWPLRRRSSGGGSERRRPAPLGAPPPTTGNVEAAAAAATDMAAYSAGPPPLEPPRRRWVRVQRKRASKERFEIRTTQAVNTLIRVALPTAIAGVLGLLYFDNVSLYIRSLLDVINIAR